MSAGKAHGQNRQYQISCRDVLIFRDPTLVPWWADGIDVSFKLSDTEWTLDVALKAPSGDLVVAECRRTTGAVKQEDVAAFAYKVEALRKVLGIPVAGIFMTKSSHQLGAVRVGQFNGITLAVLAEDAAPPGFDITFLRYDVDREAKLRDIVSHIPTVRCTLTAHPVTLTYVRASGESESR